MLNICLAQIEITAGQPAHNIAKMLDSIAEAKKNNVDILIFPEMAISGYLIGDDWEQDSFVNDCLSWGEDIIAASEGIVIIFGNIGVDRHKINKDGRIRKYNAIYVAQNGKLIQNPDWPYPFMCKTLFPNYREFNDSRHFYSLDELATELQLPISKLLQPLTLTINHHHYTFGLMICEDIWDDNYSLSPINILCTNHQIDCLINISASPFTIGKSERRHKLLADKSLQYKIPIIYVNNVGIQNNGKTIYTFDGQSAVYSLGKLEVSAPAFAPANTYFKIEGHSITPLANFAIINFTEISSIFTAITYGIRQILSQFHMHKVVIGISGGIDSAVAAALYSYVLGPENVYLINMPSKFNSSTTKGLAYELGKNLGCNYATIPIQESVDFSVEQFSSIPMENLTTGIKTKLNVSSFVKENIQARDRSSRILAGVAASLGCGFTCNANKTETTVGYCTLYGDEAGFVCALADLWKFQVYELAHYLNKEVYNREVIPQGIIDIVPSAELSTNQNVDEGKGDPIKYPYHDYLFRSFIETWKKLTPEDILRHYMNNTLEETIGCKPGLVDKYFTTPAEFIADLERWWNLFSGMAVAKRIQAPPILALSRRAYGQDHRESQNGPYYTRAYLQLKAQLLGENPCV